MNGDGLGVPLEALDPLTPEQKLVLLTKIRAALRGTRKLCNEKGDQETFFATMKWIINIDALEKLFDDPWVPGNSLAVRDAEDLASYLRRKHAQAEEELRRLEEEGYDYEDESP